MTVATQSTNRALPTPSRDRVELILSHLDRLPALPGVVARLIAVTSSDDSSARDVVSIIESDPALTAGILRMVRRADLGVRSGAMTVHQAVTLLGMRTVRNAALSSQFFETLSLRGADAEETNLRAGLWEHSLAVACAAELIAQRIAGAELAGNAFVCGLLHDVGKIALDVCLPKSYAKAVQYAQRRHACITQVEVEVFGIDHTVAGKRLATRWQLPLAVQECVWLHHQNPGDLPKSIGNGQLVRVVHLADNLVRHLGMGLSGYGHTSPPAELARKLGLASDVIEQVAGQLPEKMIPIREALGLQDPARGAQIPSPDLDVQRRLSEASAKLAAENDRLRMGADCLGAVGRFTELVSENDPVGDVCAAAAEALAVLFGAEAALVHVLRAQGSYAQGGFFDSSSAAREAMVLEIHSPADEEIWRQAARSAPSQSLCAVDLSLDGVQARVLLVAQPHRVRAITERPQWRVVARTIGLAIAWSNVRSDSEAMTQELLDLNRRCREAEKQLVRMRSISMVGEMAAGAAHELNNPLAVIAGRAQMELGFAVEPERRRAMEIVDEQAKKASQIVADLMSFAKPDAPQPARHSVAQALHSAIQRWKQRSGASRVKLAIGDIDPSAGFYADLGQFHEILAAVVDNAAQAVDPVSGGIQINLASPASDESVRIEVTDNGPGMSPEVLEHAFDPFFSHRPAGRGRGMGLTRAYRLAEINGGRLWIDSKPGQGTTVTIELPSRPSTS